MRHYQTDSVTSRLQTIEHQTTLNIRHLMLSDSLRHRANALEHSKVVNKPKTQLEANHEDDEQGNDNRTRRCLLPEVIRNAEISKEKNQTLICLRKYCP